MTSDLLASIVGIVLVAAAAAFVLVPFARGAQLEAQAPFESASADRFRLYRQVLEMEFDRDMGKLSDADFEHLSSELLAQAGQALRDERGSLVQIDDEIEREIAAARAAFAAARRSQRSEVETLG